MKKIFSIIFLTLTVIVKAQVWVPATPFPGASGVFNPNSNYVQTNINSLCVFNNELYVGGNFTSIGGIVAHCIARWNGTSWNSLGPGNFLQNTMISDIIVFNGNLYFTADKLYKWNGSTIQEVTYFNTSTQMIQAVRGTDLHVFNDELYIVSDVVGGGGGLLKYDGVNFTLYKDDVFNFLMNCVDDFNNSIYVGTNEGLFRLGGNSFIECNGVTTATPEVYDIESYNNDLYVIGNFNSIGGVSVNNFAKYNGSTWSNITLPNGNYPLTNPFSGWNLGTNHLNTINNELYLAHTFANNQTFVASPMLKFNGSQWLQISQNYSLGGGCSAFYNNQLYCGGNFPSIFSNTVLIEHFAKLQNSVGLEESYLDKIEISPNPASNCITIKVNHVKNDSFSIFDHMGRVVLNGKLNGISTEVYISALPKGIYTLKIEGNYQPAQIVKE
jgi:hypothetical protein